jgi:hypothetical protein
VANAWVFFGSVNVHGNGPSGPTGPSGPQGIGVYAATCAGGPPPTSISEPAYTCNAAFNFNMVLCSLPSEDGNAGIIYECICTPGCAWTQIANLNEQLTFAGELQSGGPPFNNTQNVWNQLMHNDLGIPGTYTCQYEGVVTYSQTVAGCPLFYGISSVPYSDAWIDHSLREANVAPITSGSYRPMVSIATTAVVVVSTAPETIYVTAGIGANATTGCNTWNRSPALAMTLRCLRVL